MNSEAHTIETSTNPDTAPAPVFIVGMNGSGTTMMLDLLDNHPAFYGFPLETKILPYYLERLDRYGDLSDDANFQRLWDDIRNIVYFKVVNNRQELPRPADWRDRERTAGAVIDSVFRHFSDKAGKRRWCEKSPMYGLHMDLLAEVFPDARFVHLIRDGRDCAGSFHRRWGFTPQRTMYRWKKYVEKTRAIGASLGDRYLEVRYEELTDDPRAQAQRICNFVGEAFYESMLSITRRRQEHKTLSNRVLPNKEKWRTQFTAAQVAELERIGGRLLSALGYETQCIDGDDDPPSYRLAYWRHRDNAKRLGDGIKQFFEVKDWKRRRLILQRLATNIKQRNNVGIR